MKNLTLLIVVFFSVTAFGQTKERELKVVTFSGVGYELGLQHGKALKGEIAKIIGEWKRNTSATLAKDANQVIDEFYTYARFDESIKKWTPQLYAEIQGIADGSEQEFKDVMILNLLDEFWVYVNNINNIDNHHCSSLGVPGTKESPGYISQNMDLEAYTDGYQVLMRLERNADRPEQLILTYPGLIGLNGMNEYGIGVVVNTLMQLTASSSGLPVAFVVRGLINSPNEKDMLHFIGSIKHASGQNYILGIKGAIYDYEASTNKVVRYDPKNPNGSVYHTNHPIVNDDVKPWFKKYDPTNTEKPKDFNSYYRFEAVQERIGASTHIDEDVIMATLRSRDDPSNPVCRSNKGGGFTFSSILMTMADSPYILITAGPPDESEYKRFGFKE